MQMDYKIDYLDSEFKADFINTRSGKSKERSWKENRSEQCLVEADGK